MREPTFQVEKKNLLAKLISVLEGDSHKSAKTVIAPKRHPENQN